MKSVGEVMAIGRTFKQALLKAVRSLETGKKATAEDIEPRILTKRLVTPHPERLHYIRYALSQGMSVREIAQMTNIDPWFLHQLKEISDEQATAGDGADRRRTPARDQAHGLLRRAPGDALQMKDGRAASEKIHQLRKQHNVRPVFKRVDTCAAEFESFTPYLYSTYEDEDEATPTDRKKVIILGSGPNRIGQGIEFDYCCCHAAFALRDDGYETIMVNCNPETVSTDYDTSDRLYFEPLTYEDVMAVYEHEAEGGADRRDRAVRRADAAESRAAAEGRGCAHHRHLAGEHRPGRGSQALRQTAGGARRFRSRAARSQPASKRRWPTPIASAYPVLVRPSYVLGGRAMVIAYDDESLIAVHEGSGRVLAGAAGADRSLPRVGNRDRCRRALRRRGRCHRRHHAAHRRGRHSLRRLVLRAARGRHSASTCSTPSANTPSSLARALKVIGLMNVQYAIQRERSTSSRSIRAPRAPCRMSPRRPACRWRRLPRA